LAYSGTSRTYYVRLTPNDGSENGTVLDTQFDLINSILGWNMTGQTITERTVLVEGDTAVVFGTTELRFASEGNEKIKSLSRYTAAYIKRDEQWQMLALQMARRDTQAESYREDVELAETVGEENATQLFLDLRAACESGWDFSARWFAQGTDFATIRTTQILPVDLNSLLYHTERVLSELYAVSGDQEKKIKFTDLAERRYKAINDVLWNGEDEVFMDRLWTDGEFTGIVSAASFYPMYFRAAKGELASQQVGQLLEVLLDGGPHAPAADVDRCSKERDLDQPDVHKSGEKH